MTWASLRELERTPAGELDVDRLSGAPGIYAWWRDGEPLYLGEGVNLRKRLKKHLRRTPGSVRTSTFKRSVAAELGIATRAELGKGGTRVLDETELDQVLGYLYGCEVSWALAATKADARRIERALLAEYRPPLNLAG